MSKERFGQILAEYDFVDSEIEYLWETRPEDDLDEQLLRRTAERFCFLPLKNQPQPLLA